MERWSSALVDITSEPSPTGTGQVWRLRHVHGVQPWKSDDPDSEQVWWQDAGVHQNLAFGVHPDPVSGAHAWHQKVTVEPARPEDRYGDVVVDTGKAHEVYRRWLELTHPAPGPDGTRRPYWLFRPYRPAAEAYQAAPR
jgi:hypothetical protein